METFNCFSTPLLTLRLSSASIQAMDGLCIEFLGICRHRKLLDNFIDRSLAAVFQVLLVIDIFIRNSFDFDVYFILLSFDSNVR